MALNANPPDLAEMRVWRPVQTPVVTIDSVIGDRVVAGMKVDTEGFELKVLRGCARALAEQRIRLIQLEWNAMSQFVAGTDRRSRFCPQKQLGWSPGSSHLVLLPGELQRRADLIQPRSCSPPLRATRN
jgi:hypothetical protein